MADDGDTFIVHDVDRAAEIEDIAAVTPRKAAPRKRKRPDPQGDYDDACAVRIDKSKRLDAAVSNWHLTLEAHNAAKDTLAAAEADMEAAVAHARAASLRLERGRGPARED